MPFVTGPSATSSQPGGIRFTKFVAPASDRLVAEQHASSGHQFFHITEAHTEPEVELSAVRNDLLWKPMPQYARSDTHPSIPSAAKANVTTPKSRLLQLNRFAEESF